MSKFVPFLLCLFFFLSPKVSGDSRPFIAVFCNPEERFIHEWDGLPVDLLYKPETWQDFRMFCKEVKKAAGTRGVILDIDVHGEDYLYLQYEGLDWIQRTYRASMGSVCSTIEKELPGQVLEMDVEACNAGKVYRQSIRHNHRAPETGDSIEDFNEIPQYPIYGINSGLNYSNAVFLQRINNSNICLHDLRHFELESPGQENPMQRLSIRMFLRICELSQTKRK